MASPFIKVHADIACFNGGWWVIDLNRFFFKDPSTAPGNVLVRLTGETPLHELSLVSIYHLVLFELLSSLRWAVALRPESTSV